MITLPTAKAKEPLDALCVGDVPMLLRLIRRSAKLGAAEVLGKEVSGAAEVYFPSAWPEGMAEQVQRFNWKQGMHGSKAIKLAGSFRRASKSLKKSVAPASAEPTQAI